MTPLRRVVLAGLALVAGGALAFAGTRATWFAGTGPASGRFPVEGLGEVSLPAVRVTETGVAASAALAALGLLLPVGALLYFLVGPRARAALTMVLAVAAIVTVVAAATARSELAAAGPGRALTLAGAAIVALAAAGAFPAAARVGRLRMPESAPDAPSDP